jgi:hypothetical protein
MKRLALTVGALLLAACGGPTHSAGSTVHTTKTVKARPTDVRAAANAPPQPKTPKTVIGANGAYWPVIDNDGTFLVGVDILPGEYRSAGGTMCYWARLGSPDPSDIVDSKKADAPQTVGIEMSDTAFLTENCGTWQMISLVP